MRSSLPYSCVLDIPMVGGILVRGIVGDHSVLRGRMGDGSWLGSLAGGLAVEMGKGEMSEIICFRDISNVYIFRFSPGVYTRVSVFRYLIVEHIY